jgi:hypothetical protein
MTDIVSDDVTSGDDVIVSVDVTSVASSHEMTLSPELTSTMTE